MDMNNLEPVEIWLQSLGLLYKACEPLTFDCLRTEEEQSLLMKDITDHAYYCSFVKYDVEKGKKPKTWDEWISGVEEFNVMVSNDDRQGFGDLLTKIFDGES
jgi:hypothetical protein